MPIWRDFLNTNVWSGNFEIFKADVAVCVDNKQKAEKSVLFTQHIQRNSRNLPLKFKNVHLSSE